MTPGLPLLRAEQSIPLLAAVAYERRIRSARGLRRLYQRLESRAVERALGHVAGDSVLDCPCGTGRLDPLLRARFRDVVGVDRSAAMLAIYRQGDRARVATPPGRCSPRSSSSLAKR